MTDFQIIIVTILMVIVTVVIGILFVELPHRIDLWILRKTTKHEGNFPEDDN